MEPERKIEKLLRAYAKKRRADAGTPLELPSAIRQRLQREAAQRVPGPEADDSISLWQFFRQQWVLLTGFAVVIFMVATMLFLPALAASKKKAQRIAAINQLQQIGVAIRMAADTNGKLPASLDALTNQLISPRVLIDLQSGKPFVYIAGGQSEESLSPQAIWAYSAEDADGFRAVLMADGSVDTVDRHSFEVATAQPTDKLTTAPPPVATVEVAMAQNAISPKTTPPTSTAGETTTISPATGLPIPAAAPDSSATFADTSGGGGGGAPSMPATHGLPLAMGGADQNQSTLETFTEKTDRLKPGQLADGTLPPAAQLANRNRQELFQNKVAAKDTTVLAHFQVLPDGNTLRVVDGDGSVYEGSWQLTNAVAQNAPSQSEANQASQNQNGAQNNLQNNYSQNDRAVGRVMDPAAAREQLAFQNYSFQVTGTNRTLKQKVVFTGNLMVLLDAVQVSSFGEVAQAGQNQARRGLQSNAANNNATGAAWSNARIIGTAVVANTNHIEINAALP